MGVTLEQHRSAIGRFKPSGSQRVSAKSRREIALSEVMAILAVTKIRREACGIFLQCFWSESWMPVL